MVWRESQPWWYGSSGQLRARCCRSTQV